MLVGWIAAVIGIIIVVFSLNRLIREIRKGGIPDMEDQSFSDTFYALLNRTDQLGENLDDINQTFYETVERLEKRIEALEKRKQAVDSTSRQRRDVTKNQGTLLDIEHGSDSPVAQSQPGKPDETYMASQIRKLLSEGKDSQQVARELNLGVGEVELIRRLKSNQQDRISASVKNPKSPT